VRTAEELAEWTAAAGLTNILSPDLVTHAKVRFLAARDQHGISAGAVANLTGPVVGVSNVFATTLGEYEAWAAIPAAVNAVFPSAVPVGYEHGTGLRAAIAAGFSDLGPLRVWLAP
jgi:ribosomal protein S5